MAENSTPNEKKHRVIAWKPENTQSGNSQGNRLPRWMLVLFGTGGSLLVIAGIIAGFYAYRTAQRERRAEFVAVEGLGNDAGLRASFVSRSRAEFSREAATRGIQTLQKAGSDHPSIMQHLIELEIAMNSANEAFIGSNYAVAIQRYDAIAEDTKAFAQALEDRRIGRQVYDQFLVDAAALEKFKPIAPEIFEKALAEAGAARSFFDQGSFSLAREQIETAAKTLLSIVDAVDDQFRKHLSAGRAGLARGDGNAATAAFKSALELKPGDEVALAGIERARHIGQVFQLLDYAKQLIANKDFEGAQEAYERAFRIDSQSAAAQAGISSMKVAIRERDFNNAVERARVATENKEWEEAITAYEDALKVFPNDDSIKTKLAEARVHARDAFINRSLASAYDLERKYEWDQARNTFLTILEFEPGQTDAEEGLLRTGKVLRALLKFDRLMEDARELARQASFQSAIATFNEAMASKPAYVELSADQQQLKDFLILQNRPVEITFISDKKTYVTIPGITNGYLGKFEQVTVPVLPGDYLIIGRRRGYEEVREVLRVRAEYVIDPITVSATTKLASL